MHFLKITYILRSILLINQDNMTTKTALFALLTLFTALQGVAIIVGVYSTLTFEPLTGEELAKYYQHRQDIDCYGNHEPHCIDYYQDLINNIK